MSAALSAQKSIRATLINDSAITSLVPANSILDRHQLPAPSPSIVLGEAQTLDEGIDMKRRFWRVFSTLHVWKKEASLEGANTIAGAISDSLTGKRFADDDGFHCVDSMVSSIRLLRDPDGETSHAIITVETLLMRVA